MGTGAFGDGGDLTRRSARLSSSSATRLRVSVGRFALASPRLRVSETETFRFVLKTLVATTRHRRLRRSRRARSKRPRTRQRRERDRRRSAIVVDRSASARTLFAKRKESVRATPRLLFLLFVGARRRVGRLLAANFRRRVSSRGTTPCRGCNTPTRPRPGRNPRRRFSSRATRRSARRRS